MKMGFNERCDNTPNFRPVCRRFEYLQVIEVDKRNLWY